MADVIRSLRIDEKIYNEAKRLAEEQGWSFTFANEKALKMLCDKIYMESKSTIINDEIVDMVKAIVNVAERNINNKTNSYLSELAIQTCIQNMILAKSLEISDQELNSFRIAAINFLKERQRLLRLDEIV